MKISWPLECSGCQTTWTVESSGDESPPPTQCPNCGMASFIVDHDLTTKILLRAREELKQGDVSISLILSAMAIECELARLFFKWKALDADMSCHNIPEPHKSQWDNEYRDLWTVNAKLDGVCQLMTDMAFDSYVSSNSALVAAVHQQNSDYQPGTSPKQFFQERLFWKRNEIIHYGNITLSSIDGQGGYAVGLTILWILQSADHIRRKKLEERLLKRP